MDRNKFLDQVRVELILNLMSNNVGTLIALSPDSLYIKPARNFTYDVLRLSLTTGKIIDLPVVCYKEANNRKRKV
ncbi:hypothetical protein D3C71_2020020 [compost metagenome]